MGVRIAVGVMLGNLDLRNGWGLVGLFSCSLCPFSWTVNKSVE